MAIDLNEITFDSATSEESGSQEQNAQEQDALDGGLSGDALEEGTPTNSNGESASTGENQETTEKASSENSQERSQENDEETSKKRADENNPDREREEEEEEAPPLIDLFKEQFGYDYGDEEFEDTPDGLFNLAKASARRMADEEVSRVFGENEHVKPFVEFVEQGGDPKEYFSTVYPDDDYSEVEVVSENTLQQKNLIEESLRLQGYENEDIQEALEGYEASGLLETQAKLALKGLRRNQESRKQALVKEQEQRYQQQLEEQKQFWNSVQNTVEESKDFKGISIPESKKSDFMDFISKPVDNDGRTARDLAASKLELEDNLLIDYLLYVGLDKLDSITSTKSRTNNARSLRSRLKGDKETPKGKNRSNSNKEERDGDIGDITSIF